MRTPCALQPAGHRSVAFAAVGVVAELEGRRREVVRSLERGRVAPVARDRDDGQPGVEQSLQIRAGAADEDADHASAPITSAPARRLRHNGAHADPEVEDAARLLFLDAALGEPLEDGRPFPRIPVDPGLHAVGQHAREVAEDAAAGDVGERLDVGVLAQRAHVVEVERVRREHHVGVEVVVTDDCANEGVAVRVRTARRKADDRVAGRAARAVDQLVAIDDADARPGEIELVVRGRRPEARPSRRRSACSRRRGRPRRRLRRDRRPARARCGRLRRSRGRRAASRRCRATSLMQCAARSIPPQRSRPARRCSMSFEPTLSVEAARKRRSSSG